MSGDEIELDDEQLLALPTVRGGSVALGRLLNLENGKALEALGELRMSEILHVLVGAKALAAAAATFLHRRCEVCLTAIVWNSPGWAHIDPGAANSAGAHAIKPDEVR